MGKQKYEVNLSEQEVKQLTKITRTLYITISCYTVLGFNYVVRWKNWIKKLSIYVCKM